MQNISTSNKDGYKRGTWKKTTKETPKGVGICPKCHAIFYKKSWHNPDKLAAGMGTKSFEFHVCGACDMISKGVYEGEVVIGNVAPKYESDLAHLIVAFGKRSMMRDNQDRIVSMTKSKSGFKVTTTENQLANKLGKKIQEVFKGLDVAVSYSSNS